MKPLLAAVGSLGSEVASRLSGVECIEICEAPPGSLTQFFDRCGATKYNDPSQSVPWYGIIADPSTTEAQSLIAEWRSIDRGQLKHRPSTAYIAATQEQIGDSLHSLVRDDYFQRVFLLRSALTKLEVVDYISRVLEAHGAFESVAKLYPNSAMRFVTADALPLPPWEPTTQKHDNIQNINTLKRIILPTAFEAVDILIIDLRKRVSETLTMAAVSWPSDIGIFKDRFQPVNSCCQFFIAGTVPFSWKDWLAALPRGFEAKERIALSLGEAFTLVSSVSLEALSQITEDLLEDKVDECMQCDLAANIKDRMAELDNSLPSLGERLPHLRDNLTSICLRLLKILDSSFFRCRLLKALIAHVWSEEFLNLTSSRVEQPDLTVERYKNELRGFLQRIEGERVIMIAPESTFPRDRIETLRSWIEGVTGNICEIVAGNGSKAWLYLERPITMTSYFTSGTNKSKHHRGEDNREEGSEAPSVTTDRANGDVPYAAREKPCRLCGTSNPILPFATSHERRDDLCKGLPSLTCSECGCLNKQAWWLCWEHGKDPIPVPIDKVRCPDCILRHHENPEAYPLSSVGVNPGFAEPFLCPHCEDIQRDNPCHCGFTIPKELIRFYRDGVNGHDSVKFRELAKKFRLIGDCRCPACGTLLIPVHHRAGSGLRDDCDGLNTDSCKNACEESTQPTHPACPHLSRPYGTGNAQNCSSS